VLQAAMAGGHRQGVGDQFGAVVVGHRIPDHLAGRQIDHRRQVHQTSMVGRYVMSPTGF
jgi:hypothetical protein